ncbi:MAG: sigma-54 dependent transcriptional regulator [Candidatus Omnitrophica bacterium]|nr:sigma-54 dependent transcriptional regulator [Candidatus Omnitrophota bacterium]
MSVNGCRILVVDDEPLVRKSLYESLRGDGFTASMASNGEEAYEKIAASYFDIVITDMKMPKMNGIELLKKLRKDFPSVSVVLITGYGNVETAVEAMKIGAFDYVTKPINDAEVRIIIDKILEHNKLIQENINLRKKLANSVRGRDKFHNMVGKDAKMQKIYTMIEAIADSKANVLITGDSGTGKRLVAQAIHATDKFRKDKVLVEMSCGALPETLLESELFGHVKGAFTGAIKDRKGRFESADNGTIFLDEIDTFSPIMQVKLLRVLQEGEFERVGETKTLKVDVRVIAATNQRLEGLIKEGKFRSDLYYRLNVINIELPRLKDRVEDLGLLVSHFIEKHNKEDASKKITGITKEAMAVLEGYSWPGNIRELENMVARAVVLARSRKIDVDSLPEELQKSRNGKTHGGNNNTLKDMLAEPERDVIRKMLDEAHGNKKKAALKLGINRTTLYNKIKKYGLN